MDEAAPGTPGTTQGTTAAGDNGGVTTLEDLNALSAGTMFGMLGMRFVEATPERIVMTMPVGPQAMQPLGVLHGGATVALAESAASVGTWLGTDHDAYDVYGLEINCNHLRAKRGGMLRAVATPVHRGRRHWVWDVRVSDENDRPVAISRCTIAVVPRQPS